MKTKIEGIPIEIEDPNVCPHCHVTNNPHRKWHQGSKDVDDISVIITAWECSNNQCKKLFLALYKKVGTQNFKFERFLNGRPKGPDWPKPILELKNGKTIDNDTPEDSKFIKTYLQSLEAEMQGLDELAGMGFRKAIEYLVKDWAIQNNPDDKKEIIEDLWLSQVIKNYYDGDLKDILERAKWLGNDQSHYNRLFEEYDVNDLKKLISLIMVELDRQYQMGHYIKNIQSKK